MTRTTTILLPTLLIILTAVVLLFTTPISSAETITVDDDGGADYENIQDAIDAAKDGDTILVKEGRYKENVVVDKTLSLVGEGNESTIIENGGNVVEIRADWVNISGFKIKNGSEGIEISSNHTHIFENNFSNNDNYGLVFRESNLNSISNNIFFNNGNYGIHFREVHNTSVVKNIFDSNRIGAYVSGSNDNDFFDNLLIENEYGLFVVRSNRCMFQDNTCTDSEYGFYVTESENNSFLNNICKDNSNSMYFIDYCDNNFISNNTCSNSSRGIKVIQDCDNSIISNNICDTGKWGIFLSSGCDNNLVEKNVVSNYTNAITLSNDNEVKRNRLFFNDIGILIWDTHRNEIINNTIYSNKNGIELTHSSKNNTAHNNFFYNNTEYAINATDNDGYSINATDNWFGHTFGPFHPENNSAGKGDNVTDYVLFEPWLKEPQNYEPVVSVITSISPNPALVGTTISFVGSVPEHATIEQYAWRSETTELYNGTKPGFSLSNLSKDTHTIYLKVQDNYGIWSEEVSTKLIVHEQPTAKIVSISPTLSVGGEEVTFTCVGADDGLITTYVWREGAVELYNGTEPLFSLSNLSNGTHTIYLKVQDDHGVWSEEVSINLTVNGKPRAQIESITPNSVLVGTIVSFTGSGTDDGAVVRYLWFAGEEELYNDTSTTFTLSSLDAGTHEIKLKVQDDQGAWSDEVSVYCNYYRNWHPFL